MLPGFSIEHIILLGLLALVVVGPKDLPLLLHKLGRWTAKLRGLAQEFRSGFDDLARQAELDELKAEVDALRHDRTLSNLGDAIIKPAVLPGTLAPIGAPQMLPLAPPPAVANTIAPPIDSDAAVPEDSRHDR